MDAGSIVAHVDESSVGVGIETRLYVMAVSLTEAGAGSQIDQELQSLLPPGRRYLHHYDETADHRVKIANCLAGLPLICAMIVVTPCRNKTQESARRRILTSVLPRLQHVESVGHVIFESRGGSDKTDRRTVNSLRKSRSVTGELRIDSAHKADDSRLWIADFMAGSWIQAHHRHEVEPWRILADAHLMDVTHLSP